VKGNIKTIKSKYTKRKRRSKIKDSKENKNKIKQQIRTK